MEINVIRFIAIRANMRITETIYDYIPPVYDSKIYPTHKDYAGFYLDSVNSELTQLCLKIKQDCIDRHCIDSMENNTLDDDIYIIVCDLLEPFINCCIKSVIGDYPHIILKDWRC